MTYEIKTSLNHNSIIDFNSEGLIGFHFQNYDQELWDKRKVIWYIQEQLALHYLLLKALNLIYSIWMLEVV